MREWIGAECFLVVALSRPAATRPTSQQLPCNTLHSYHAIHSIFPPDCERRWRPPLLGPHRWVCDNKTGRPAGTIYTSRRSVFPPYNSWSAASTTSAVDHKMGKSFYRKVSLPSRHVRLRIPFCKKHRQLWRRLSVTLQKANSAALAARIEGARPREDGRL